jgi:hypothetical protein
MNLMMFFWRSESFFDDTLFPLMALSAPTAQLR